MTPEQLQEKIDTLEEKITELQTEIKDKDEEIETLKDGLRGIARDANYYL